MGKHEGDVQRIQSESRPQEAPTPRSANQRLSWTSIGSQFGAMITGAPEDEKRLDADAKDAATLQSFGVKIEALEAKQEALGITVNDQIAEWSAKQALCG